MALLFAFICLKSRKTTVAGRGGVFRTCDVANRKASTLEFASQDETVDARLFNEQAAVNR